MNGENDFFRAFGSGISNYNLTVWNRWGELMFETDVLEEGWDGIYKGLDCEIGTYIFYVRADIEGIENNPQLIRGNVTLVR